MQVVHPGILVLGPAYVDNVWLVDGPLIPTALLTAAFPEAPLNPNDRLVLDRSVREVDRHLQAGGSLVIRSAAAEEIEIVGSASAPLPYAGVIRVEGRLVDADLLRRWLAETGGGPAGADESRFLLTRTVGLKSHRQLLGGMGAGFAAALGGALVCALGSEAGGVDEAGATALRLLVEAGVEHHPQLVEGCRSDTTLLVTSGVFGDKLPVGRRQAGEHLSFDDALSAMLEKARVVVLAGIPNSIAGCVVRHAAESITVFAPTMRNVRRGEEMLDFADHIGYLSCNQEEWQRSGVAAALRERIPLVTITRGKNGAQVLFRDLGGAKCSWAVPAYGAETPPVDTNRAGESFAAAFLTSLLAQGDFGILRRGRFDLDLIRQAGTEAAVAAFLQVQTAGFCFPTGEEIASRLRRHP